MDRLVATLCEPGTTDQDWPPSVDLKRPRPASESPEPFGSPDPAYRVLPVESVGSTISDPNAFVGRSDGGAIQVGCAASASLVRQMPPPAAATQSRQLCAPQFGSIASAVTRPDSWVSG